MSKNCPPFSSADPASADFRLEDSPFYWINRVSGRYGLKLSESLKPVGMDVPGWRVLMILFERGPTSVKSIADTAAIRLPTMTRTIQRMTSNGLVSIRTSPDDGRVTEVSLTDEGRSAVETVRHAASRTFTDAFVGINPTDIRNLNATLGRVFEQLG